MTSVSLTAHFSNDRTMSVECYSADSANEWIVARDTDGAHGYHVNSNYVRFWQDAVAYVRVAFGGSWFIVTEQYAKARWEAAEADTVENGVPAAWASTDCKDCWTEARYMRDCGVSETYPALHDWLNNGGARICPYCCEIACWEQSDGGCGEW